jgi:hypothetical protein
MSSPRWSGAPIIDLNSVLLRPSSLISHLGSPHPANMAPRPARVKSAESVDFFLRQVASPLPQIGSARDDLRPILKLLNVYLEILDQNGSVAKHLYMPLFSSKIEDRITGLFSTPRPQITGLASDNHCDGICPSWVNLIQEPISKDQFELLDGYRYRCFFRGRALEMSESDRDALSSDVLRKLVQVPPEPEDVQTEREARAQLIQDLTHLQEDISQSEKDTPSTKILHTLTTISNWKYSSNPPSSRGARYSRR